MTETPTGSPTPAEGPDVPSELAWLRAASGDRWLRPWRLTPERLAAYLAGVRAVVRGGPAVEATDAGAALDPDRHPALRPWELGEPSAADAQPDLVALIADELEARPPLAALLRPHVALDAFAAAHLKLTVCLRAFALLVGDGADGVSAARVEGWVLAQDPRAGGEADFAADLVTAVAGRADVDAAFQGR